MSALLLLSALALAFSCTKDDRHIPDGGGLNSVFFVPGFEKVILCGDFSGDAGVAKINVSWTEGEEGKNHSFDIAGTSFQEPVDVSEGDYLFNVTTYNAGGGKVASFPLSGKSYGTAAYVETLTNRGVAKAEYTEGNVDIKVNWSSNPANCVKTEVSYSKTGSAAPVKLTVEPGDLSTTLEAASSDTFEVLSYYYPDGDKYVNNRPSAIPADYVFEYVAAAQARSHIADPYVSGIDDVTSTYLKNYGPNFEAVDGSVITVDPTHIYGLLKEWSYTPSIVNQAGDAAGGWKYENDQDLNVIHFETKDWGGAGYQNGKVWQSPTLPAGTYAFTANYFQGDGDPGVEMYVVAATGTGLPDIENLSGALASKAIDRSNKSRGGSGNAGDNTIVFTVTQETQVSLGLVVSLVDGGRWQQFRHFRLDELTPTDITSDYLQNAGLVGSGTPDQPGTQIQGTEKNGNWGVPLNWNITDNVRNQENNSVGGWKHDSWENGTDLIHFESAGWSDPGTGFTDGKVWQSPTLPAGTYTFTVYYIRGNVDNCVIDLVAAEGTELPGKADIGNALASLGLTSGMQGSENSISFTLTEEKQVSLGLLVSINSAEQYIQFTYFKLISMPAL